MRCVAKRVVGYAREIHGGGMIGEVGIIMEERSIQGDL